MGSWNQTLIEVQQSPNPEILRKRALNELARVRGRNVICYYSGWMQHDQPVMDMNITDNDVNGLMNAICGMDRSIGLDIVLHTPGGDLGATEAIVEYLRDCFGNNVCAIVPQLAMSAGTMIACSCNEIIMGRQSSLGPTDPQVYGMAAGGVIEEFIDGENPLFLLRIDDREIYVPAVDEFIVETDLENGVIRFDLPDGLIDLND